MTQQTRITQISKIVGYLAVVILIILVVGLLATNYHNGIVVIIGIVISYPLFKLLQYIIENLSKTRYKILGIGSLFIFLVAGCLILLFSFLPQNAAPRPCPYSYYRVVLSPETPKLDRINIQEYVILNTLVMSTPPADWTPVDINNQTGFSSPVSEAKIENHGFLLKEVTIPSIGCSLDVNVELHDFPLNTFYEAHYAEGLQKYPYIDTETITWNAPGTDVKFSYIPPPFQLVKPLLTPLIGASSLNQWLIGIIGVIGSVIFVPIIQPVLIDAAQKAFKNKINGAKKPTKRTTKVIISEKDDKKRMKKK